MKEIVRTAAAIEADPNNPYPELVKQAKKLLRRDREINDKRLYGLPSKPYRTNYS